MCAAHITFPLGTALWRPEEGLAAQPHLGLMLALGDWGRILWALPGHQAGGERLGKGF